MVALHVPAIMAVERRAYEFPWTEGVFRDCLRAGYSGWVLLGRSDALLGYAVLTMAVGEAHVLNVCVAPEHQRRGYGGVLMHHLLDIARAHAVGTVFLEVRRSNGPAIALYSQLGFHPIGERRGYYPDDGRREDALVYALELTAGGR
ncbi:MAG: ribosomal-protein-alanine N-acetyltransferase [Nevskiaceae bacterium]|nr:MAG: ribosomal-protein-alanine N-acetyltransferase [Nevskiaceae bacterium]TBR74877.1 MAG: ribosomal-protein-alanine N-acetyltransferase [Nevskiaceae bacterium]